MQQQLNVLLPVIMISSWYTLNCLENQTAYSDSRFRDHSLRRKALAQATRITNYLKGSRYDWNIAVQK